jgi:hypothetical protein
MTIGTQFAYVAYGGSTGVCDKEEPVGLSSHLKPLLSEETEGTQFALCSVGGSAGVCDNYEEEPAGLSPHL